MTSPISQKQIEEQLNRLIGEKEPQHESSGFSLLMQSSGKRAIPVSAFHVPLSMGAGREKSAPFTVSPDVLGVVQLHPRLWQQQSAETTGEFAALRREMTLLRQDIGILRSEFKEGMELWQQEMSALRSELTRLIETLQGASRQMNGSILTLPEQRLVIAFIQRVFGLPHVEAVGYRRDEEGMLEICTLLSTRELDPEREINRLSIEVEDRFPDVDVEFRTLLTPPGSLDMLKRQGYEISQRS